MPLTLAIALRFLFRSRSDRPLTLFTFVAVTGIALSVFLFLVIDAVMNGFSVRLREVLSGFDAPLTRETASKDLDEDRVKIAQFISGNPEFHLQSAEGREFYGLLEQGGEMPLGIKVRSVGKDFFRMKQGKIDIAWNEGYDETAFLASSDAVLLGEDVYKSLPNPFGGDVANLIHPFAELGPGGDLEPRTKSFEIAGFFSTGYYDIDHVYIFIPGGGLDGFADPALAVTQFYLAPRDIRDTVAVKEKWIASYPGDAVVWMTWLEKNTALFKAMSLEKIIFYALFVLLVVIACLNLAGVIRIFGLGKLRDGVILAALGMEPGGIAKIFWILGSLLGAVGGIIGVVAGSLLIRYFERHGIELPEAYGFGELPLAFDAASALWLLIAAPLIAGFVAFFPARRIAMETVSEGMRET